MRDFKVDSMGRCFICLTPRATHISKHIKLEPGHPEPSRTSSSGSTYSLQRLSRYLDMDMRKMFTEEQSIPPILLTMVAKSKLKADLCADCFHLVQKFGRLHQQLEKIQMEMNYSLGLIRRKFLEVDEKDMLGTGSARCALVEKINIVNALRKEAVAKCSLKLLNMEPRVKLENLATDKALSRQRQIKGLSSTTISYQQYILPNSHCEEVTYTNIDMGIVKVEPQLPDSGNSVSDSETALKLNIPKPSPNHRQSDHKTTHPIHACLICGKGFDNGTNLKLHHNRVHNDFKFRCQKCKKQFKRKDSLIYHQRQGNDCTAKRVIQFYRGGKFRCKMCNHRFADATHLTRHFRSIHLKLKEHGCRLCKKKFARKDGLHAHMRRIHKTN